MRATGLAILVAGVVVGVYWPVLSAGALSLDDFDYLTLNPLIQKPGWDSTWHFVTEVLKPSTVPGYYQPLTMICLASVRRTRLFAAGGLFFLIALLPVLGLIGFTHVLTADRYVYFPTLGLLIVLAGSLSWLWSRSRVWIVALVLILAAVTLEVRGTRNYLRVWRDSETLARHMVQQAPDSGLLYNQLGYALFSAGKPAEARPCFEQATQRIPEYPDAHFNLGNTWLRLGEPARAVASYQRALEFRPDRSGEGTVRPGRRTPAGVFRSKNEPGNAAGTRGKVFFSH